MRDPLESHLPIPNSANNLLELAKTLEFDRSLNDRPNRGSLSLRPEIQVLDGIGQELAPRLVFESRSVSSKAFV